MTLNNILPEKTAPVSDLIDDDDEFDYEDEDEGEAEDTLPAGDAKEEPAPALAPKQEPQEMVPLRELTRLRAEKRVLRDQVNQMIALLGKAQPQAQQPAGQPQGDDLAPKPGEADGEYLGRVINHLVKETQETKAERETRLQREQQQMGEAQYVEKVMGDYREFAKQAPDLLEAGKFLAAPLQEHLSKIYPSEMVPTLIGAFERDLHQQAEQAGMGYGEYIWQKAQEVGYVPQAQRQKQEVVQQKRAEADRTGRGLGGASSVAGGMTQTEAMKAFHSGKTGRMQKIPELGGITVEEAFVSGAVRKLRK